MNPIHGSCRCTRYRFRALAEPFWISYCHCTDCRKATGAPVTVFVGLKAEEVELLGSPAAVYHSSDGISRLYCAACGSPIACIDARLADEIYFYLGVIDQTAAMIPTLHSWASEQLPWLRIDDHLPTYQRFSRDR